MIAARSPRASFDDERRDDARQPNDGSTRADGGAVPPPSPTRGAGHAGEATTSSSALGKMQVPWQKMKHGVKDITRKLAALKAPAVLDKFKPSSPPFNRPNPSSEGWVGAPAPPPTRPTAPGATVSWTLGAEVPHPNAPFGEQSDPPEGYVNLWVNNFSRWQKRWLVATTPGFWWCTSARTGSGDRSDSSTSRTRPSWSPTWATRGSSSWSPARMFFAFER